MQRQQTTADVRWRDWLARGADSDRRTSTWMTRVRFVLALGVSLWLAATVLDL